METLDELQAEVAKLAQSGDIAGAARILTTNRHLVSRRLAKEQHPLSLTERAASFVGITAATILRKFTTGEGLLSEAEIEQRLSICRSCDQFTGTTCLLCGCSCNSQQQLTNKLAHAASQCPHNPPKW